MKTKPIEGTQEAATALPKETGTALAVPQKGGVVVSPTATSLLEAITRAASDPSVDIDKMERLFGMHEKMVAREAEIAFNAAISRAQAKIQPIVNNSTNEHTRSTYADQAAINKQIVPIYTAEGLSISFDTETKNDADPIPEGLHRTLAHVSHAAGHTRRYHIDLPPDDVGTKGTTNKTAVQASGSTNSYARRYLTRMIFNLSTEDDADGNKAKGGKLAQDEYTAFEEAIGILETDTQVKALVRQIGEACDKAGDLKAYRELRAAISEKAKTFKKVTA